MLVIWHLRKLGLREINLPKATQLESDENRNQTQVRLTPKCLEPTFHSLAFRTHVVLSTSWAETALLNVISFHENDNIILGNQL